MLDPSPRAGQKLYFLPAERNVARNGREKKGRNCKKTHPPALSTGEPMAAGSGAAANLSRLLRGSGSRQRASEATASSRVATSLAGKCRGSDREIRAGGWRRAGKCRAGGRREGEAPASAALQQLHKGLVLLWRGLDEDTLVLKRVPPAPSPSCREQICIYRRRTGWV